MQAPKPEIMRSERASYFARDMFDAAVQAAEDFMGMPVSPYLQVGHDEHPFMITLTMWHPVWSTLNAPRLTRIHIDGVDPVRHMVAAIVEHTRTGARMRDWAVALETLGLDPFNPPAWTVRAPRAMAALLPRDAARAMTDWRNGRIDADTLMCMEFGDMRFTAIGGGLDWSTDGYPRGLACDLGTTIYQVERLENDVAREIVRSGDVRRIPGLEGLDEATAANVRVRDFQQDAIDESTVFDLDMGECVPLAPPPPGITPSGPLAKSWRGLRLRNSFGNDHRDDEDDEAQWDDAERLANEVLVRHLEGHATRARRHAEELLAANVAGSLLVGRLRFDAYEAAKATVEGSWPDECVVTLPERGDLDACSYRLRLRDGLLAITEEHARHDRWNELDAAATAALVRSVPLDQDDPRQILARAFALFSDLDEVDAHVTSRQGGLVTADLGGRDRGKEASIADVMDAVEAELVLAAGERTWTVDVVMPFAGVTATISIRTCDDGPPIEARVSDEAMQTLARHLPTSCGTWFPDDLEIDPLKPIEVGIGAARRRSVVDASDEEAAVRAGRRMLRIRRLGIHPGTMVEIDAAA